MSRKEMKSKFLLVLILCLSIFLWLSCGKSEPPDEKQPEPEQSLAVEKKPVVKEDSEAVPEESEPDDVIFIDNEGYEKDRKEAVMLTHRKHEDTHKISCIECHHAYKDGEGVWLVGDPEKRCIECHDPSTKRDDAYKLQMAYHRSCRRCHRTLVLLGKSDKAPFRKCGDCHGKSEE